MPVKNESQCSYPEQNRLPSLPKINSGVYSLLSSLPLDPCLSSAQNRRQIQGSLLAFRRRSFTHFSQPPGKRSGGVSWTQRLSETKRWLPLCINISLALKITHGQVGTLANWRKVSREPEYAKLDREVLYYLKAVDEYERTPIHHPLKPVKKVLH